MTILIDTTTQPPVYPLTEQDLRAAFPGTSFPLNLDEETVSPFGWHLVASTPRPADTRIERYEDTAQIINGQWQQRWQARDATAGEQAEWDEVKRQEPDWDTFRRIALGSLTINRVIAVARANCDADMDAAGLPRGEPAASALPLALSEAMKGDFRAIEAVWMVLIARGGLTPDDVAPIVAAAAACNLPPGFIAALQPHAAEAADS